jgi:hypothetical protein
MESKAKAKQRQRKYALPYYPKKVSVEKAKNQAAKKREAPP